MKMPQEFINQFIIKEVETTDGGKKGKKCTLWYANEKEGTYQSTALNHETIMWELQRCFDSRLLRESREKK